MFPATGSTTKHAIWSGYFSNASAAASRSLYGTRTVFAVIDLRDAGARRCAERQGAAARLDEQRVDVAVVAADALDDEIATRRGPREADARSSRPRCRC